MMIDKNTKGNIGGLCEQSGILISPKMRYEQNKKNMNNNNNKNINNIDCISQMMLDQSHQKNNTPQNRYLNTQNGLHQNIFSPLNLPQQIIQINTFQNDSNYNNNSNSHRNTSNSDDKLLNKLVISSDTLKHIYLNSEMQQSTHSNTTTNHNNKKKINLPINLKSTKEIINQSKQLQSQISIQNLTNSNEIYQNNYIIDDNKKNNNFEDHKKNQIYKEQQNIQNKQFTQNNSQFFGNINIQNQKYTIQPLESIKNTYNSPTLKNNNNNQNKNDILLLQNNNNNNNNISRDCVSKQLQKNECNLPNQINSLEQVNSFHQQLETIQNYLNQLNTTHSNYSIQPALSSSSSSNLQHKSNQSKQSRQSKQTKIISNKPKGLLINSNQNDFRMMNNMNLGQQNLNNTQTQQLQQNCLTQINNNNNNNNQVELRNEEQNNDNNQILQKMYEQNTQLQQLVQEQQTYIQLIYNQMISHQKLLQIHKIPYQLNTPSSYFSEANFSILGPSTATASPVQSQFCHSARTSDLGYPEIPPSPIQQEFSLVQNNQNNYFRMPTEQINQLQIDTLIDSPNHLQSFQLQALLQQQKNFGKCNQLKQVKKNQIEMDEIVKQQQQQQHNEIININTPKSCKLNFIQEKKNQFLIEKGLRMGQNRSQSLYFKNNGESSQEQNILLQQSILNQKNTFQESFKSASLTSRSASNNHNIYDHIKNIQNIKNGCQKTSSFSMLNEQINQKNISSINQGYMRESKTDNDNNLVLQLNQLKERFIKFFKSTKNNNNSVVKQMKQNKSKVDSISNKLSQYDQNNNLMNGLDVFIQQKHIDQQNQLIQSEQQYHQKQQMFFQQSQNEQTKFQEEYLHLSQGFQLQKQKKQQQQQQQQLQQFKLLNLNEQKHSQDSSQRLQIENKTWINKERNESKINQMLYQLQRRKINEDYNN